MLEPQVARFGRREVQLANTGIACQSGEFPVTDRSGSEVERDCTVRLDFTHSSDLLDPVDQRRDASQGRLALNRRLPSGGGLHEGDIDIWPLGSQPAYARSGYATVAKVEATQRGKGRQARDSRIRDQGPVEAEIGEAVHPSQMVQPGVGDARASQIENSQALQSDQALQPGLGKFDIRQIQFFQERQPGQFRHAAIGYVRASQP